MKSCALGLLVLVGCAPPPSGLIESREAGGFELLDDTGLPLGERPIEVGEDLGVTLRDLAPDTDHTLVVIDEEAGMLFTLAAPSDARGSIDRLLLWPDLGLGEDREGEWFATRELAPAQERLAGRRLRVVVEVEGEAIRERSVEVARELAKPRVFVVDERGQITRGATAETGALRLVATHLAPGAVDVLLLPDRAEWREGDELAPGLSRSGEPLAWRVEVGERGELAIPLDPRSLPPGGYQLAIHPPVKPGTILHLDSRWVLAKRLAAAVIVQGPVAPYWPGASIRFADVSTRANAAAPYFTREDVFHTGEPVWATFDLPLAGGTSKPSSLARKVRFYVVPHRTATEWRANAPLVDVSGHVVEALVTLGGTTGNRALIGSALAPGRYDIVVDTGNQPPSPSGFVSDDRFDAASDFVDGVTRVGFTIVDDPGATGPYAVGITRYEAAPVTYPQQEIDGRTPITTRVVGEVRYPATVAGEGATMPTGTFPVVVIAHGNTLVYRGHDELLAHLASHGYIAVSIDLVDLSWAEPAIDLRARLVLDHVALLSDPTRQPGVLQGHVDTSNISLVGHSRGGDAVLRAAYFAKRDGLAFRARAVAAIAPTDISGAGLGANRDPSVIDAPYFALYGSSDNDVGRGFGFPFGSPFTGGSAFRAYDRNTGPKAMVFVEDACHNLFNEERMVCEALGNPVPAALSRAEHLMLLRGYLTAFLAWHVHGDDLQRVFFEPGALRGASSVAHHQLHDPKARVLDDFEDLELSTNTAGGTNLEIGFVEAVENPLWMLDGSAPHVSAGRLLRWTTPGAEQLLGMPRAIDLTASGDAVLSLRVAQAVGLVDCVYYVPGDLAALDAGQLTQPLRDWFQLHGAGTVGVSVVVEAPGSRWRIVNGAQRLLVSLVPNGTLPSLAIRNADIAETRSPLPIRLRLRDATGATRTISAVVPAPLVPVLVPVLQLTDIDKRTLAALETIRIPISAFAIPDASGTGVDPTQITEVAIEVATARGELLVDDLEVAPW